MQKQTDEDVAISVRTEIFEFLKFKLRGRDDAGKMLATHYLEQKLWYWFKKLRRGETDEVLYSVNSRLVAHAQHEFSLLPKEENQADADLQQWLQECVLDLLFVLSRQGHSGGTMAEMLNLFGLLANFKVLSPITDNPAEWEDMSGPTGYPFWQNKRDSSAFSKDGGKTYWLADGGKNNVQSSAPHNHAVQAKED